MTFQEARDKLKEIAEGKYHAISYEVVVPEVSSQQSVCTIYIDGEKHYYAGTWEDAFRKRDIHLSSMPEEAIRAQQPGGG